MKKNIDNLIKNALRESLYEKSEELNSKIKTKMDEWNPNEPVTISAQPSDMHEMEEGDMCEQCGSGRMEEGVCNECGYGRMEEEMDEELHGGQKKLDVAEPKGKLTSADFKKLRSMKKNDMDEEMEEGNAFTGALAKAKESGKSEFEVDGKKYHVKESKKKVKESIQLTESEIINLIEKIVLEQKKAKGMAETEKVLKADKKENDQYIKDVTKKMKDYLKGGSKGEYTMEPKVFPKGNGALEKDSNVKKYTPSDAVDEYVDAFAYPGMTNLVFDEIKPDDERIDKYLKGHKTTGNAQVDEDGNAYGNVVPSKVGEKFKKNYDDNLYGAEQMDDSYKRQPQDVLDVSGEKTTQGSLQKLRNKKANKAKSVLNNLDESKQNETPILNEEFNKMKHLMGYNKKTQ